MAELTSSELRQVTGIAAKNLYNYRVRGHIVQNGFKKYDLTNESNKAFIEQYGIPGKLELIIENQKEKAKPKQPKPKAIKPKPKTEKKIIEVPKVARPKKETKPKPEIKKTKTREPKKRIVKTKPVVKEKKEAKAKPEKIIKNDPELSQLTKVNLRLKEITIRKSENEMKLKELELLHKQNSLIELEKVINISKAYSDNFTRGLLQTIKTFIQDICARHNIETGKTGEYKLKIADIINKENEKAVKALLKEFGE